MISSITLLAENDYVGMTFWLATAIMLASTVFFFVERSDVSGKWRTSMKMILLLLFFRKKRTFSTNNSVSFLGIRQFLVIYFLVLFL